MLAAARHRLHDLTLGALQRLPGHRVVWHGPRDRKRVALTFDDGPDELTPRYLDLLDRLGVPATFFLMGDLSEQRPAARAEYLRRGHQLGGHGYDHRRLTALGRGELREQLTRTARALGPVPQGRLWVRPPYGAMGPRELVAMLAAGHVVAMWSFDSHDHEARTPEQIVARCAPEHVSPGDVLLFHESQEVTLAALPRVVEGLRAAGYELVTMADLVAT
ncbi:MAG: polysaccharide deacetylase family protein [Kofleriaceae bacterium]|nr:polysaccharide deacetylase family protein [Kofleriaceae bacterium]MCL4226666.1 polysaccharide deacetylase family protein [Myxococcales bacterium]